MTSVNVVYFTSRCNYNCEYCYEHLDDAIHKPIPTKEELRSMADKIIASEPKDEQTSFVLFGGEPTLSWKNVKYFVKYAYSKKHNSTFNLTSNGSRFVSDRFIEDYEDLLKSVNGSLSLDISFDGVGNFLRKTRRGVDSTPEVMLALKKLKHRGLPFRIRYTIQRANHMVAYEDIKNICNDIKPTRVIVSVDGKHVPEQSVYRVQKSIEQDFKNGCLACPVCAFCCEYCKRCVSKSGISYWQNAENIRRLGEGENAETFKDFGPSQNNKETNNGHR